MSRPRAVTPVNSSSLKRRPARFGGVFRRATAPEGTRVDSCSRTEPAQGRLGPPLAPHPWGQRRRMRVITTIDDPVAPSQVSTSGDEIRLVASMALAHHLVYLGDKPVAK